MKALTVKDSTVYEYIRIVSLPFPHIVLGKGGNKKATPVALGERDAPAIVLPADPQADLPDRIVRAGVIRLQNGRYLVVAPREEKDNRALVLWSVSSGYRGSAKIAADEGVVVVAYDHAWHSGQGALGKDAEMLAILRPGQGLRAKITGRHVQNDCAVLKWDGRQISVAFFPSDAEPVDYGDNAEYL